MRRLAAPSSPSGGFWAETQRPQKAV